MLWDCFSLQPVFSLFSDTSGSLGCGAFWGSQWFHLQWLAHFQPLSIAVKELVPVIIAAVLFGFQWRGHLIQFSMDNMNVVHVLNSTYSKDPHLMHMFHTFWCSWQLTSIFGSGLSTLKEGPTAWQTHCLIPIHTTFIPAVLMALLGNVQDWTSPNWIALFNNM